MSVSLLGLRTVIYFTHDLQQAKAWYSDVFGIAPYFDQPFYVGFNVGGYELGLHPLDAAQTHKGPASTAYWGVDDAESAFEKLVAAGAMPIEKPTDVGDGVIVATVKDPWGNLLGIIKNPHFRLP